MKEQYKSFINLATGVLIGLAFFIFFTPFNFASTPLGQYDIFLRIPMVFVLGILYIYEIFKTKKIDVFLVIFNIYSLLLFLATVRSHADIVSSIWGRWIVTDAFIILFILSMKRNQRLFLLSIYITLYLMILWDMRTTWVPKELWGDEYENVFFGNYNYKPIYYFPAIIIGYTNSIIYNDKKKWVKISFIILEACIIATSLYVGSATAIITFTSLIIYLNIFNKEKYFKLFNIYVYLVFDALFFVVIVLCGYTNSAIGNILALLNKAANFSNRVPIWNVTKEYIIKKPLIGYGVWTTEARKILLNNVPASVHAHNFYLNTAFESGLLGTICKAGLLVLGIKNALQIQSDKIKGGLMAGLGIYLFAAMFESYHDMSFLSIILVMYLYRDMTCESQI